VTAIRISDRTAAIPKGKTAQYYSIDWIFRIDNEHKTPTLTSLNRTKFRFRPLTRGHKQTLLHRKMCFSTYNSTTVSGEMYCFQIIQYERLIAMGTYPIQSLIENDSTTIDRKNEIH
jgi:hypothetical protein